MSDQLPPGGPGGPGEDRPAPLIPSRAARHQKKGGLLRGRGKAPKPPQQSQQFPPPQPPPVPPRSPVPPRPEWPEGPDGSERPSRPELPDRREWVRPVPDLPPGQPRAGAADVEPEIPRRRPALKVPQLKTPQLKAPQLKTPQLKTPQLSDLRGSGVGLAATLVVLAAVLVLGANALPSAKPPATPVTRDPYSARWVCPLMGGQTTPVTIANVGETAASLRTTIWGTGRSAAPATKELAAGKTERLSLRADTAGYVQVEAFSAPVVVSAPGLGCAPGPSNRWWLPASDTRFGSDTKVIIANPDSQPATVDLIPHLTSGSIRPDQREVFIKPGQAVVKSLGDEAPTGLKPSIEVIARAGRVVAGAAVSSGGRPPTLLPAQGAAKPAWSFAGGISGGGRQTQVLVTNPNATPLQVEITVTTKKKTFKPEGDFGEPIANGGTAELAIPALDVAGPFAVQVRSTNGAPFVAALRVTRGDGNQLSSDIDLGTGQSESGWLVPGKPGGDLMLANLSSVALEARLGDLTGGGTTGDPVALPPGRVTVQKVPDNIQNLVVQAGSAGLVAAPLNGEPIVPGSAIGGLPPGGPIVPGPAAAP